MLSILKQMLALHTDENNLSWYEAIFQCVQYFVIMRIFESFNGKRTLKNTKIGKSSKNPKILSKM
jgi:hypothetical protein